MPPALIAALVFTVALLVTTAYFLMGSVPLLILKHDTPMDARFVRGFFNTYYLAVMFTAGGTALSYLLAGKYVLGVSAALLALVATTLRRQVIPRMDALQAEMPVGGITAVAAFRRIHGTAIAINVVQLVLIVWSLMGLTLR